MKKRRAGKIETSTQFPDLDLQLVDDELEAEYMAHNGGSEV